MTMKKIFFILFAFITFSCEKNFGSNYSNSEQQGQQSPPQCLPDARCMPITYSVASEIYGRVINCRRNLNDQTDDFDKLLSQVARMTERKTELGR